MVRYPLIASQQLPVALSHWTEVLVQVCYLQAWRLQTCVGLQEHSCCQVHPPLLCHVITVREELQACHCQTSSQLQGQLFTLTACTDVSAPCRLQCLLQTQYEQTTSWWFVSSSCFTWSGIENQVLVLQVVLEERSEQQRCNDRILNQQVLMHKYRLLFWLFVILFLIRWPRSVSREFFRLSSPKSFLLLYCFWQKSRGSLMSLQYNKDLWPSRPPTNSQFLLVMSTI